MVTCRKLDPVINIWLTAVTNDETFFFIIRLINIAINLNRTFEEYERMDIHVR